MNKKYTITIDGIVPVRAQFHTWAKDEFEAEKNISSGMISLSERPDINISKIVKKKIVIKDCLTSLIKITKSF